MHIFLEMDIVAEWLDSKHKKSQVFVELCLGLSEHNDLDL